MNSRGDLGDGFTRAPLKNQFMGSWTPVTPRQGRSSDGGGFYKDGGAGQDQREELLGRSNLASSQAGYNVFELDDLLDTDQMPFSFTSLLSGGDHLFQVPQCGTPASSKPLYNLNSPPTREAVGYICESSVQSVPSTPSLCRTEGRDNGFLEAITRNTAQKPDNGMQSVVASSTEVKDGSRQNDLGFDLNQTPQQKPAKKKKKFMPKVFVKGKPIRKPRKPASQEAVKPKATGTGKRKKPQKTNIKESETNKPAIGGDMSNKSLQITQKSCRKALTFDLEKTGDVGLDDSEPEIFENTSGSNSFTETRDVAGGTSGSCLDSVTQVDQTNGLVAGNQLLEASTAVKLPRESEVNHSRILARDQQPELFTGNQQRQFPMGNQQRQFPMGNQQRQVPMGNEQAWLQMRNQLCGFPVGNQQPRLALGNQQPMYLMGTPRSALASRNQQPGVPAGGLQGNNQPLFLNQQTQQTCVPSGNRQYGSPSGMQQTCLPAGNRQYGSPSGMQQRFMSRRGQQHGMLLGNQQPVSPVRGQQPCVPLMNKQPGAPKGFTHLNQMVGACMSSSGLRPYPQSQTPATNLYMGSVSRTLNGTAGTWQRSSIAEYGSLPQDFRQGNECIPSQERSNAEYFDVRSKALSQNSYLPTPDKAKHVEARGSKRQHDRAMGHMQNSVAHLPLLQQIAQPQYVERQNSSTSAKHLDAAKKMKIQKAVQEKSHGVAPEVIVIEDDPTDGERKDKSGVPKAPARKVHRGRKKAAPPPARTSEISCLVQNSADNEKCIVPKTPARKGPRGRKKTVPPPPPHASEIQVYEPTPAKAPSSRSKAKEKGMKSKQDSGKARGQSGELRREDYIAEIIYRLQNLYLGDESREQEQNALALYRGDGAVVPYETKKKKPRPKVDLDDETTRIWNLLMGKEEKEGDEEMNKKKEKWWEEERNVFRGRADSFIARMHLVQGDRRFSPWKGSVVDSVIGVFLTQNVTDHLSSSAFMSLAARFPPKSSSKQEDERNIRSVVVEDPEGCILNLNDIPPWQEKVQTSSDTQVSGVDSGSKEQQRYSSNSGIERFSFLENSSQNLEEEVLSSQDSFDPASWPFQSSGRVGSSSGSKSDAEFSTTRSETKSASGSAQSVQIGSPNLSDERSLLHQESGDVQIQETSNVAQKKPDMTADLVDIEDFGMNFRPTNFTMAREMKGTLAAGKKPTSQWDSLRREVLEKHGKKERSKDSMDSIDYEAVRRASVHEISDAIKERGMNYMLAVRIKDFLERIVKDHGAVDLEWLRDVHPDKAKDYLLSIRGLGLKSVECVRLLTLHNLAFPVDTNVGRIAVRLGWVPLQPLPDSLQLHLLELYPVLESIQKFLWPRLCQLDQPTLYELHYQLITFGKVFCTKSKPNCNACPMRGECRHFASAYASARLALPAPEEKILTSAAIPVPPQSFPPASIPMMELPSPLESFLTREAPSNGGSSEPIIEEPASPEQVCTEITESDIEDAYYNEDPDEIPTIELNITQFGKTLKEHMKTNMELQEGDMSKALVALHPSTTSIPTPKLKNISRLRTEHLV
ncbi:hypothetical protein Bca101_010567 [Brassica carinata]